MINLLLTFVIFAVANANKKSYEGYKLYSTIPEDEAAVNHLEALVQNGLGEIWSDTIEVNQEIKINVSPEYLTDFLEYLTSHEIKAQEVISNIQRTIEAQLVPAIPRTARPFTTYTFTEYKPLKKIYEWLDSLSYTYPETVEVVTKGDSYLGNPIKGVVINYHPERNSKLIGVLEGTLYGREWICPATITWIINEFLTSTDQPVRALAENFEWHIFPVLNPDGYKYTFTDDRMWKKNRNPRNLSTCVRGSDEMSTGVNLNRNFDFHWMSFGANDNPCSDNFAGPAPFSEPESTAVRDYILAISQQGKIVYYITFHSFGQTIVVPYSLLTAEKPQESRNHEDVYRISLRAAESLKQKYGTEYSVGTSASGSYAVSGSSFDWVKAVTRAPVALLLELRDRGDYGFLLPPDQIVPTAMEAMDALLVIDKVTKRMGYYSSGVVIYLSFVIIELCVLLLVFCT